MAAKKAKKRKSSKKPSAAQLAARKKFAAAARACSKAAKKKRAGASAKKPRAAAKRTRNKTVIVKPKRVLVINGKKRAAKKKATKRKRKNAGIDFVAGPKRRVTVAPGVSVSTRAWTQGGANRKAARAARRVNSAKASPKVRQLREKFVGTPSRKTSVMHVPNGTPANLAKLGRVVSIKLKGKTVNPASGQTMWLCSDARGKLHLASPKPWPVQNPKVKQNLGEVMELEYSTPKPHLGFKKNTIFFHKMGEEGGRRPTLVSDGQYLRFKGGSYKISPEGIRN